MPVPTAIFEDNDRAAHAIYRYACTQASAKRFSLRPYQYQNPKETAWWIIPSDKWPAYRFSKLFIDRYELDPDYLFAGFYVEKGLDDELEGLVKSTQILRPNWYWHNFLDEAEKGKLDKPLQEMLEESGCPVFGWIDFTGAFGLQRDDLVELSIRSPDLRFEVVSKGNNILSPLNLSTDMRDLANRLRTLEKQKEFCRGWVNLLIGIRLRYGNDEEGTWSASDIWSKVLQPWLDWVH